MSADTNDYCAQYGFDGLSDGQQSDAGSPPLDAVITEIVKTPTSDVGADTELPHAKPGKIIDDLREHLTKMAAWKYVRNQ